MQTAMDQVSKSCDNYDLTISTKKTEVVHQPAPGKPYNEPTITVNGQKLKVVDKFTYLGSTLSRAVHIDDEFTARIAKASVAFGRLRANVWERNEMKSCDTKLKVYKAVVLPTLLYACETWTVYQRHAKRLNHFHLSCLRKMLKIIWQDKFPDTEVLKKAGMQSIFKLAQVRRTGQSSMENYKRESALKVARRNATKTPLKPLRMISTYQWGLGNRLHRSDQSGEVSSTKEQLSIKKREYVKLREWQRT